MLIQINISYHKTTFYIDYNFISFFALINHNCNLGAWFIFIQINFLKTCQFSFSYHKFSK